MIRALLLLACTLAGAAHAADDPEALIKEGVALRKSGHNAEALALFRRAFDAQPSGRAEAQIALAEQALGAWAAAEVHLDAALAATADPWIKKNRGALAAALEAVRRHLGWVHVSSGEAGAELWIDGTRTATLPMGAAARVVAGEVVLELRKEGFRSARRAIEVVAGRVSREQLTLTALPPLPPPVAHAEPPPGPVLRTDPAAAITAPPPPSYTAPLVLFGVAGAAVAAGIVAHVVREGSASTYNSSACFSGELTRDQRCGSDRETAEAAGVVSVIGYALAAVAAAGATWLLVAEDP